MLNSKNNNIYGCYIYPAILSAVKKELSDSDKILLCKVILLCQNKDKTCYAGNSHLSKELGKSQKEITRGVSRLVNKGLLNRKIEKSDKRNFNKRYLFLTKKASLYLNTVTTTIPKIRTTPTLNNDQHNTNEVNINNVNINDEWTSGRSLCTSLEDFRNSNFIKEETISTLRYYLTVYKRYKRQEHPRLRSEYWRRVIESIESFAKEYELTPDKWESIIDGHFETPYKQKCDFNLLHFISPKIIENRYYEKIY